MGEAECTPRDEGGPAPTVNAGLSSLLARRNGGIYVRPPSKHSRTRVGLETELASSIASIVT
jgi:hypothetical protein